MDFYSGSSTELTNHQLGNALEYFFALQKAIKMGGWIEIISWFVKGEYKKILSLAITKSIF